MSKSKDYRSQRLADAVRKGLDARQQEAPYVPFVLPISAYMEEEPQALLDAWDKDWVNVTPITSHPRWSWKGKR